MASKRPPLVCRSFFSINGSEPMPLSENGKIVASKEDYDTLCRGIAKNGEIGRASCRERGYGLV